MFYFRAINCLYVTSRDQYQALRLATVVHVMKSTPLHHPLRYQCILQPPVFYTV